MGIKIGDRITTEDHLDSTTIIINPKIERWKLWLLTSWLVGFTCVGLYMIYLLAGGAYSLEVVGDNVEDIRDQQLVYLIVFLGFWGYFEFKTLRTVLWYFVGKELFKLDSDGITHKRSVLGYGKSVKYFFDNIKNLDLYESDNTSFGQFFENAYWSLGTDGIVFTYFGKQKSFGRRVDEKTGRLLLRFIEDKAKTFRRKKQSI